MTLYPNVSNMNHLILDYNVIIEQPEVLSYRHADFKLWLDAESVKSDYYAQYQAGDYLREMVRTAVEKGNVFLYSSTVLPIKDLVKINFVRTDAIFRFHPSVNAFYETLAHENPTENIYSVASSVRVKNNRIKVKTAIKLLREAGAVKDLQLSIRSTHVKGERALGFGLFFLFLVALFAAPELKWLMKIANSNLVLATIAFCMMLFLVWLFFRLRRRNRLFYGAIEIVFGLFLIGKALFVSKAHNFDQFDYFSLLSGAYVIIRGLDNIETALKSSFRSNYYEKWERFF